MKKSLIALAVLAASGAAFAQSSVQVYGLVDLSLAKAKGVSAFLNDGSIDQSRIGFKGTEDIGGGLKVNFVLEQGFNSTNGTAGAAGAAFSRETSVGVSGAFGAVKAGRMDTAYEVVKGDTYAGFDSVLSPAAWVFRSVGNVTTPNSGVFYASPTFGGFKAAASYHLQANGGNDNMTAFNVGYENGPFYADVAFQDEGKTVDRKLTAVNGAYTMGAIKLKAGYGREDVAGTADTNEYHLGVDYTLAPNLILSGGFASSKTDGASKSSSGFSLSAAYVLSKRTIVYGGYFDANKTATTARGAVDSLMAVGLKHTF